jgi:DNA-binding response OmpR family regulator
MTAETDASYEELRDCRVLVVEDDDTLARRIADRLHAYTGVKPRVAHSVRQAHRIVADAQGGFELAVVDVMLPQTEVAWKRVRALEQRLDEAARAIREVGPLPSDEAAKIRLADARYDRARALPAITDSIDRRAGIGMVKEWRDKGTLLCPVLYLTAVGNDLAIKDGLDAGGANRSDWLVKPAPTNVILEKCSLLIRASKGAADGGRL